MNAPADAGTAPTPAAVGNRYGWYALGVLVIVYATNFIDRQILSILAEDIKADLALDDAQLGFLFGFALFLMAPITLALLWLASRRIAAVEATREERAAAAAA